MAKIFAYAKRACKVQFFEEDPVVATIFVGDESDKLCLKGARLIEEGDKCVTFDGRMEKYKEAVELFLGTEKTDAILERAEEKDCFALLEIWQFIVTSLREHKVKNLTASAR